MSLEIMFTSNTDPNPALKDKIDKVIKSWEEIGVVSKHMTFSAVNSRKLIYLNVA